MAQSEEPFREPFCWILAQYIPSSWVFQRLQLPSLCHSRWCSDGIHPCPLLIFEHRGRLPAGARALSGIIPKSLHMLIQEQATIPGEWYWYGSGFRRIGITLHLATILPGAFLVCFQFVPVIRHKLLI